MIYILISTFNGTFYLKQQLDSLSSQTYQEFKIIVRDDLSTDSTLEILKSYNLQILPSNQNLGAKKSFSMLMEYALLQDDSDYIMFCDQDDIWHHDKIEKTYIKMQQMEKKYGNIPLLVHTDLEVVDDHMKEISSSFFKYQGLNPERKNLHNLLVQNNITGCTVMINKKLAQLALPVPDETIMHDWWIGLVASYFGKIGFLDEATISYRQHHKNSLGARKFDVRYVTESMHEKNVLYKHSKQAKVFLDRYKKELDDSTVDMLMKFANFTHLTFWQKRGLLFKYKLLKHGLIRNIGLFLKV